MQESRATPGRKPRMRARLMDWRPGIAWQLGIAFIGVAVLAAVANFAVQRTINVTTTRIVPAAPAAAVSRLSMAPLLTAVPPGPQGPRTRDGRSALPALERLSDAVQAARLVPAADRHQRARQAGAEVRATLADLHGSGRRADAALRAGEHIIDVDAMRDAAYQEYAAMLERVGVRMRGALDKAWKIFGRVVARQSLVVADQRFEELRRRAEILRDDVHDASGLATLQVAEAQFGEALVEAERTLVRSQGDEWYAQMRADFAGISAARATLVRLDAERAAALPAFQAEVAALRAALERSVEIAVSPAQSRPAVAQAAAAIHVPDFNAPPRWESAPRVTTREEAVDEGIPRTSLAWLSASVLVLLLGVSVLTVLSILRPVQRLIAATQRIAQGETGVRVPHAGSRELDRLADAFNRMAGELESAQSLARNYQQRLEARVVERTRQLQHQADHDALTQLPNRRQLFGRVRAAIETARIEGTRAALFFIDLDNFKIINDGRGHGFGDRVLVAIAQRLAATIGTRGFAARFGGDEFTVVVETAGAGSFEEIGWSLVRAFQQPLHLDGRELLVSVSVGAACYPAHAQDAESLLRAADAALFHAKALGRSQLAMFTPELLEAASERFTTEQGLRRAVERGEFELLFQPEIDIARMEVPVCEALLRWRRPDGVLAGPDQFLAVAEESGLIVEINDWVLRAAIAAAARWRSAGHRTLRVAVNASSRQLSDPSFAARVGALLAEHGLPPDAVEMELTENILQTGAATIAGLRRLLDMGVTVALDDFGTGYSSLASLEQLPLSRVKLDRSLIAGIDSSARSASIANAIINLCADLGVQVTAEGIERLAQLAMLRECGITVQGFLLSRPVAEAQLDAALQRMPEMLQSLLLGDLPVRTGRHAVIDLGREAAQRRRASRAAAEG